MIFLSINSGLIVDVENIVERRAHPAIPFGGICRHRILKSIKEIASGEEHPTIYI